MISLSRDDSELAFQKRQKELKEVCHNFKQVLSDIKSISQQSEILPNVNDNYVVNNYASNNNFLPEGKVFDKVKEVKVKKNNHIDFIINPDELEFTEEEEFPNSKRAAIITESCQLRAIIRELYSIQYDILNLSLILKHIGRNQPIIAQKLSQKISEITQVISRNISRAELLLSDLY